VHLDAPHPGLELLWFDAEHVPLAERPRPECPGDDGADAAKREDPVDVQPGGALRPRRLGGSVRDARERRPQLVQPLTCLRADRDRFGLRYELVRLGERQLEGLLVDRIRLRHGDHAAPDPEQAEDRQVLVGLRPCALGGVDHEQEKVDSGRPGDHVADEPLVSGNVHEGDGPAVGELERGVAEIYRDSALLLFR
jgi:hypothetical protein